MDKNEFSEKELLELARVFAGAFTALPFMSQGIAMRYNTLTSVLMKQGQLAVTPQKFNDGVILLADYMRSIADTLEMAGHENFDGIPAIHKSMEGILEQYRAANREDDEPHEL